MSRRTDRLGEQFRKEISQLLLTEIKDPRIGFVTLSRVQITEDLSQARVYASVMGSDSERESSLIGLNQSAGYIRKLMGKILHMRKIPRLEFVLDTNLDHSFRIQEVLAELKDKGDLQDGGESSES